MVELAQSPVVRALEPGQYLTVSMPRRAPSEILGVRVARRAGLQLEVAFTAGEPAAGGGDRTWRIEVSPTASQPDPATDAGLYEAGYIVVVPMCADEHDDALLRELLEGRGVPEWPPGMKRPEVATAEEATRSSPPWKLRIDKARGLAVEDPGGGILGFRLPEEGRGSRRRRRRGGRRKAAAR